MGPRDTGINDFRRVSAVSPSSPLEASEGAARRPATVGDGMDRNFPAVAAPTRLCALRDAVPSPCSSEQQSRPLPRIPARQRPAGRCDDCKRAATSRPVARGLRPCGPRAYPAAGDWDRAADSQPLRLSRPPAALLSAYPSSPPAAAGELRRPTCCRSDPAHRCGGRPLAFHDPLRRANWTWPAPRGRAQHENQPQGQPGRRSSHLNG